ncbi:uncharacterized protein KQ657_004591 [Scheffersomyces spartinae]|uniref:carnosine N-methyltransferase n=1 Tax=Scheffersomyces spartinae TaxID=45513 RepID=A0A9P7VBP5_9ASCO|nr:uncharacterized protein KQ657_004591 [Scheffersomyces spartinae]KAG7194379.1 hypothetical protein KQ657_004591 [Scheffersomyces spartinae]
MSAEDEAEYNALLGTLLAFYNFIEYERDRVVKHRQIKYQGLSKSDQKLLPWFPKYISDLDLCIGMNDQFTKELATKVAEQWGMPSDPSLWSPATEVEYDKVRVTLLQLTREWSTDGEKERQQTFGRIIETLEGLYPSLESRPEVKILVPGCGLGRLVLDLVKKGFWTQGNEISYHMLLTSNFILNYCKYANSYSIFPFLHKSSHLAKRNNQLRPITIPDSNPMDIYNLSTENPHIPYGDLMSMTAGSFVDLYGEADAQGHVEEVNHDAQATEFRSLNKEAYDVVVTCFFLDTASNIIEYIRAIRHCLKSGGRWINFGPLLWHFEDDLTITHLHVQDGPNENTRTIQSLLNGLELSREDLVDLIKNMGFEFESHQSDIESNYATDVRALGGFVYGSEFWVCKKS